MAEVMDMKKIEKLRQFVAKTGLDEPRAVIYLNEGQWNMELALDKFYSDKVPEEKKKYESQTDVRPSSVNCDRVGLRRGLSMANPELVACVRQKIDNYEGTHNIHRVDLFEESPTYTFMLPDITKFKDKKLVEFLKTDLIDKSIYLSLTKAGVLNWWTESGFCRKIFPMSTIGDGNCLLHAVSLGMWGFHDRLLTLRKALHELLKNSLGGGSLKRRWMYQQWILNMKAGGLSFTKEEWDNEWKEIIRLASDTPRTPNISPTRKISRQYSIATSPGKSNSQPSNPENFESLEEFHVFALAHVLRRPIIVIADTMLRDIDGVPVQPINFGGIYLPIECDPTQCYKYPLILGYDAAHFAALVPADGEDVGLDKQKLSSSVPLCRKDFELLPIQFVTDPGTQWIAIGQDSERKEINGLQMNERLRILSTYLNLVKLNITSKSSTTAFVPRVNTITELEVNPNDFTNLNGKKERKDKGDKSTVARALESISTLMTGQVNAARILSRSNSNDYIYAAKLDLFNRPKYFGEMINNYIETTRQKLDKNLEMNMPKTKETECLTSGCTFFGTEETNFLCSSCFCLQKDMLAKQIRNNVPKLGEKMDVNEKESDPTDPLVETESKNERFSGVNLRKIDNTIREELLIDFDEPIVPKHMTVSDIDSVKSSRERHIGSDLLNVSKPRGLQPTAPYPPPLRPDISTQSHFDVSLPERLPHFGSAIVDCEPRIARNPSAPPQAQMENAMRESQHKNILRTNIQTNPHWHSQHDAGLSHSQNDNLFLSEKKKLAQTPKESQDSFLFIPLCKSDGCKFYGTRKMNGFCSSCFATQYKKTGYV